MKLGGLVHKMGFDKTEVPMTVAAPGKLPDLTGKRFSSQKSNSILMGPLKLKSE